MTAVSGKTSVLFVIHSLGGGGAERILVNIANSLPQDVFDVTVMTIVDSGLHRSNLQPHVHYATLIHLPERSGGGENNGSVSGSLLAGKSKIKNTVANIYLWLWRHAPSKMIHGLGVKRTYDVEVAFLEGICTKFVAASNAGRKIAWVHVDVENEPKSHAAFSSIAQETGAYEAFDEIVCVSKGVEAAMRRSFPSVAKRLTVVRNPIDVREVRVKAAESLPNSYRRLFGENKTTFCSVGRLCEQKAFDRLLRAAALCRSWGIDDISVLILGEGPLEGDLKSLSKELGVDDIVHFLGYRKNPYPFMVNSNAFICVSRAEGMSTTVSEALILGVPVLSTPCSGVAELFSVGGGTIVGESDAEIAEALKDTARGGRQSNPDCKAVEEFFSYHTAMKSVESVLLP